MSTAYLWEELREKRDRRLAGSDWTQMPDCPLSDEKKIEWANYRQALRDIPQRFPDDVDENSVNPYETENLFPTKPS